MKTGSRLIIVCGLPGSGKTTLSRKLEKEYSAIRFCPDEWMNALTLNIYDEGLRRKIEALQWDLAQNILVQGAKVIIEWGTWSRTERDVLRTRARALGAAVELRYLAATPDVLFKRIQSRGRENPPIQENDVLQWFEKFEAPTTEEIALFD